jgi:DNA ligase-1
MYQIIQELEADNSRLAKEAVLLREANANNVEFFHGCRLAYDAKVTFGIKQVPEATVDGPGLSWQDFLATVELFIRRELTGNMARMALDAIMQSATMDQWNGWYRRILIKDLRCGISDKSINNALKKASKTELMVPVFSCQLAHDGANHESKITGHKQIEVKLDGVRVISIVYPNGRVDQFSRNGKELANFPHVRDELARVAKDLEEPMVFDGEVMSSSFQDLMKQVHRKDNVQAQDATLYLFDWITLKEFDAGRSDVAQINRSNLLNQFLKTYNFDSICQLGFECVNLDEPKGQKRFAEINAEAIKNGYEGIMIKDIDAPYECKRSTAWLKQKPFIEVSLWVVDLEEGTGRNAGRLGAFVCEGVDDGKKIKVNVGSGFSDSDRNVFWNDRNSVVGNIVEVRADAVTQNQDGTYSLRFPRFKTFRGFAPGEKL